ncbi:predicted protein, partial [Nematostella vectensis]
EHLQYVLAGNTYSMCEQGTLTVCVSREHLQYVMCEQGTLTVCVSREHLQYVLAGSTYSMCE